MFKRNRSYKKYILRFLGLTLTAAFVAGSSLTVSAETIEERVAAQRAIPIDSNDIPGWPQGPVVSADAAILMEAETGTILYAKNIHKQEYPASCTKILTCLIAAEQCSMDEIVTMSHAAVYDNPVGSSHIALDEGNEITMEQALNGILIASANEAAFAVGEHISGTTWQDFADIMNERAAELGCLNSHFVNPNGLPDEEHYTTAYDLAMIARAFFANELLSKISRTTRLHIPPTDKQPKDIIENTRNRLLPGQSMEYEYIVGSKTGYTNAARNCLVSCAEKDGLKLICVVFKEESPSQFEDTIALFDYGFEYFTAVNVSQVQTDYNMEQTRLFCSGGNGFGSEAPVLALNDTDFLVLPKTASFSDVVSSISYENTAENQAALIIYTWNGVEVGTASIDFTEQITEPYPFDAAEPLPSEEVPEESGITDSKTSAAKGIGIALTVFLVILAVLLLGGLAFVGLLFLLRQREEKRYADSRQRTSRQSTLRQTLQANIAQWKKYYARQARNRKKNK